MKTEKLFPDFENCNICPRNCGVNRFKKKGTCGGKFLPLINTFQLHHWEEPVISGKNGSGTIFFAGCNLKCVYCQNYTISQEKHGKNVTIDELAEIMLKLQDHGANNINFVTPTHFTPQIKEGIILAKKRGLSIPTIWNSNAYEKKETLQALEGLIDIYLPDFRYFTAEASRKYSDSSDYPEFAKFAISEMFRQVGHLEISDYGLAKRGLLIRILVLPGNVGRVDLILDWISENLGSETYISLMGQYYPTYRTNEFPEINRGITKKEYEFAESFLYKYGFDNGFVQNTGSGKEYTPDFPLI